jgi:hypothetical protein
MLGVAATGQRCARPRDRGQLDEVSAIHTSAWNAKAAKTAKQDALRALRASRSNVL